MPVKLSMEARVTIKELDRRGVSRSAIARTLGVTEGAVRYHLARQAAGSVDGRSRQQFKAAGWAEHIRYWVEQIGDGPLNLVQMHEWLAQEHGYDGSARSVQRYTCARSFHVRSDELGDGWRLRRERRGKRIGQCFRGS